MYTNATIDTAYVASPYGILATMRVLALCLDQDSPMRQKMNKFPMLPSDGAMVRSDIIETTEELATDFTSRLRQEIPNIVVKKTNGAGNSAQVKLTTTFSLVSEWAFAIDPNLTRPDHFYDSTGKSKIGTANMMAFTTNTNFTTINSAFVVKLPFKEEGKYLMAILPFTNSTIEDVRHRTPISILGELNNSAQVFGSEDVSIKFPKLHTKTTIDFSSTLKANGLAPLFEEDVHFTKMTINGVGLHLSKVQQVCDVKLDERGVDAKSETTVDFENRFGGQTELSFNRPFLYYIMNGKTLLYEGIFTV